jgi:hypothetical protein
MHFAWEKVGCQELQRRANGAKGHAPPFDLTANKRVYF